MKILLVDDDADDQFFFKEALRTIGKNIRCELASDGLQGLLWLTRNRAPDFIFLDLNMPQMNGFDFLGVIKRSEMLKIIPVVIYSTSSHQRDIEKAREAGAVAFLVKPSNLQLLTAGVKNILTMDLSANKEIEIIEAHL